MDYKFPPGSILASERGCTCPILDNHHGKGMPYPDGPRFWVSGGCPLHDLSKDSIVVATTSKNPSVLDHSSVDTAGTPSTTSKLGASATTVVGVGGGPDRPNDGKIKLYLPSGVGRRSNRKGMVFDHSYGMMYLKRELALGGEVGIPDALLWGNIIHGLGSEGGVMTAHLRERWTE